jgi:hypothetical protein
MGLFKTNYKNTLALRSWHINKMARVLGNYTKCQEQRKSFGMSTKRKAKKPNQLYHDVGQLFVPELRVIREYEKCCLRLHQNVSLKYNCI